MAFTLTQAAKKWAQKTNLEPNIILEIPKINKLFAVSIVKRQIRYGDVGYVYGQTGLVYGQKLTVDNIYPYISLSGTSDTITQQLEIDKAESQSTSSITVRVTDFNQEISRIISYDVTGVELLQEDCILWLGSSELSFPDDYIELFVGKIQGITPASGVIDFNIVHPDDIKRAEIFVQAETVTTQDFLFNSKQIQEIYYQARADVVGTVDVQYIAGASGDNAIVSVAGNIITVQIDTAATKQKTIKKKIENHEDANQLVTVTIKGNGNALATLQAITSLDTSLEMFVLDANQFLEPTGDDLLKTYARIGNEIVEYSGIDYVNNKLTGLTRGALNSLSFSFEAGQDVKSFYKLGDGTTAYGNAIDLALKVLLSGHGDYYEENVSPSNFVQTDLSLVANSIYFTGVDVVRKYGLSAGDFVTSSGATNGANNFADKEIASVGYDAAGSYIVLTGVSLVTEVNTTAQLSFASKYNLLPDGVGLLPKNVDVAQFEYIKATFGASIANYEFYLKETVKAKDFINTDIFLPSALRSIPRRGRISCSFAAPPLFNPDTQYLNINTVKNPSQLKIQRSTGKLFYNAIIWRFNEDSVEDKFLNGVVTLSGDSVSRIKTSNKPLKIEARGLRPSGATTSLIERNTARLLERFQFAAESLNVDVPFKVGWAVEVGDPVVFGDDSLQLTDISRGDRNFKPRIFECTNKSMNWKTGAIKLQLTDTTFSQSIRYGVWSPTSDIDSGSTTTEVIIKDSFGTSFPKIERDKWLNYIGKDLLIHSKDYSTQYSTVLKGFSSSDPYKMIVEPALPAPPAAGFRVDVAKYNDITGGDTFLKSVHVYIDPTVNVVSGTSSTSFDVGLGDVSKFFVGSLVRVHNQDFSVDSGNTGKKVTNITGTTITVEDLGFTPSASDLVDLIGFAIDEGQPYAWL
jgi:hypothetical protein